MNYSYPKRTPHGHKPTKGNSSTSLNDSKGASNIKYMHLATGVDTFAPSEVNMPAFLKASVMANKVGVSTKTLTRWANSGLINRFKPNPRLVLYDPLNVESHIRNSNISLIK